MSTAVTDLGPITAPEIVELAQLITLIQASAKITYLADGGDGDTITGTLRGLRAEADLDGYPKPGQDIRTTWVRITTSGGWERWEPTVELAHKFANGAAMVG
jgi:hypothetical protein